MYKDRVEAALLLAEKLKHYKKSNGVVLAVPRGGVPIGRIVADALQLPLELILTKKIGHPFNKEYAIGAVSLETSVINEGVEVSEEYIEEETENIRKLLRERLEKFYQGRTPVSLKDKIAIIVDDGIATGLTIQAIVEMVRSKQPAKVVLAVPVGAPQSIRRLKGSGLLDEIICIETPRDFYAVSQFYESFPQVTDEEVTQLMKSSEITSEK